jgi:lipoprotein signal peptidase
MNRTALRPARILPAAGVALLSLAADAATKAWALSALRDGHRITLAGDLVRFQLVANHGAAFGIGARYEPLIVAVSVAGMILLGLWALYATSGAERAGAALAAGGAAGNLADRLARPPDVCLRAGIVLAAAAWLWSRQTRPGDPARPG